MDLDALHRNVAKLMRFMERVENPKVVPNQDAPAPNDAKVQELEERLRALGERLDQAGLGALADRLEQMEQPIREVSDILPKLQGVGEMLDWFQQNKAMLEGAIAMADAFDGPDVVEQPVAGDTAASGASSEVPAPEVPAAADGSQAASDKPAGA